MQDQYINEEFSFSRLFYSGLKYYKFIYIIRLDKNWNKKILFHNWNIISYNILYSYKFLYICEIFICA